MCYPTGGKVDYVLKWGRWECMLQVVGRICRKSEERRIICLVGRGENYFVWGWIEKVYQKSLFSYSKFEKFYNKLLLFFI